MPIPSCVEYPSAALRRYINLEELQAITGTIRPGKQRGKEEASRVPNRYRERVDLRQPAPCDARPRSRSGKTSFHFKQATISKGAGSSKAGSESRNAAAKHEAYLAEEPSHKVEPAPKIEAYLVEGDEPGLDGIERGRAVLIISDIADDLAGREAFWDHVWAQERTASPHRIEFDLDRCDAATWQSMATDPHAPAAVREFAELGLAGALMLPIKRGRKPKRRIMSVELGDTVDLAWARRINLEFGASRDDRAIHFVEGRSGQVQMRFVAELPAELGVQGRSQIAHAFAEDLRALRVPFTVVVHAPTGHNHHLNHHLHAVLYPRRCVRRDDGSWDALTGPKLRPGDIADLLDPEALEALSMPGPGLQTKASHRKLASLDTRTLRRRFATHANKTLEQARLPERYDPGSYEEMGIARVSTATLGTAASALVKAGAWVELDRYNAAITWQARKRQLAEDARDRRDDHIDILAGVDRQLPYGPLPHHLARRRRFLERLMDNVEEGLSALAQLDLHREMAESAAIRLLGNTDRLVDDIRAGRTKGTDARNLLLIEQRRALACQHLDEMARRVALDEGAITTYRQKIDRRAKQIQQLAAAIETEVMNTRWRDGSVLARSHGVPLAAPAHFNELMDQIHQQVASPGRLTGPVHVWKQGDGSIQCFGLGPLDRAIVESPAIARRRTPALNALAERQENEIKQLLSYIRKHGLPLSRPPGRDGVLWSLYSEHPFYLNRCYPAQETYEQVNGLANIKSQPADNRPSTEADVVGQIIEHEPVVAPATARGSSSIDDSPGEAAASPIEDIGREKEDNVGSTDAGRDLENIVADAPSPLVTKSETTPVLPATEARQEDKPVKQTSGVRGDPSSRSPYSSADQRRSKPGSASSATSVLVGPNAPLRARNMMELSEQPDQGNPRPASLVAAGDAMEVPVVSGHGCIALSPDQADVASDGAQPALPIDPTEPPSSTWRDMPVEPNTPAKQPEREMERAESEIADEGFVDALSEAKLQSAIKPNQSNKRSASQEALRKVVRAAATKPGIKSEQAARSSSRDTKPQGSEPERIGAASQEAKGKPATGSLANRSSLAGDCKEWPDRKAGAHPQDDAVGRNERLQRAQRELEDSPEWRQLGTEAQQLIRQEMQEPFEALRGGFALLREEEGQLQFGTALASIRNGLEILMATPAGRCALQLAARELKDVLPTMSSVPWVTLESSSEYPNFATIQEQRENKRGI